MQKKRVAFQYPHVGRIEKCTLVVVSISSVSCWANLPHLSLEMSVLKWTDESMTSLSFLPTSWSHSHIDSFSYTFVPQPSTTSGDDWDLLLLLVEWNDEDKSMVGKCWENIGCAHYFPPRPLPVSMRCDCLHRKMTCTKSSMTDFSRSQWIQSSFQFTFPVLCPCNVRLFSCLFFPFRSRFGWLWWGKDHTLDLLFEHTTK